MCLLSLCNRFRFEGAQDAALLAQLDESMNRVSFFLVFHQQAYKPVLIEREKRRETEGEEGGGGGEKRGRRVRLY